MDSALRDAMPNTRQNFCVGDHHVVAVAAGVQYTGSFLDIKFVYKWMRKKKSQAHRMARRREAGDQDQHAPWIAFPVSRDLLGCWRYSKDLYLSLVLLLLVL
jgi:hypothetical protein